MIRDGDSSHAKRSFETFEEFRKKEEKIRHQIRMIYTMRKIAIKTEIAFLRDKMADYLLLESKILEFFDI